MKILVLPKIDVKASFTVVIELKFLSNFYFDVMDFKLEAHLFSRWDHKKM